MMERAKIKFFTPALMGFLWLTGFFVYPISNYAQVFENSNFNQISNPRFQHDYYKEGIELKKRGKWRNALNVWSKAQNSLAEQDLSDPRIGIAFIELVMEKQAKEFYEIANDMYFWGLSNANAMDFKETHKEIKRLQPLLDEATFLSWNIFFKEKNPTLLNEIRGFWLKQDPTPTTNVNERLLEHWERIAYARENYNKASYTIYSTDDRASIFIKYGKPDRIKRGYLGQNLAEMRMWVDEIFQGNRIPALELFYDLKRFNPNPEYEIWLYTSLDADNPPTYIFGQKESVGLFRLVSSIDELIPNRHFRRGGLLGPIYQITFYTELFSLGGEFQRKLNELETVWFTNLKFGHPPSSNTIRNLRTKYISEGTNSLIRQNTNPLKSDYDDIVRPIKMVCTQARFLDSKNEPMVAIIASSTVSVSSKEDIKGFFKDDELGYYLKHTLLIHNKNWDEIQRVEDIPNGDYSQTSVYFIPNNEKIEHKLVTAEIFNFNKDYAKKDLPEKFISSPALAIGKTTISKILPLNTNPDTLEISDLILGIEVPKELANNNYPFPVMPSNLFSNNNPLHLYFEIYHLTQEPGSSAKYNIQYQITKEDQKGLFSKLFKRDKKKPAVSLSSDYQSPSNTAKESISLDISKVEPGHYELSVTVTDKNSNQEKSRKIKFDITQ